MQSKKYNQKEILMRKKIKYIIKRRQKKVIYIWENNTKPTKMKGKNSKIKQEYKMQLAQFGTKFRKHKKCLHTIKIIKNHPNE